MSLPPQFIHLSRGLFRMGNHKLVASMVGAGMLLAVGVLPGQVALADAPVYSSALSSRIVRFIADPNNTYIIYTHPGMVTDIKLPQGEKLKALALGDTVQWVTEQVPGGSDVFVKPVKAGLQTSATLVTTRHTYQLMMVARDSGDWYQEVRFQARMPLVYVNPDTGQTGIAAHSTQPGGPTSTLAPAGAGSTNNAVPGAKSAAADSDRFSNLNLEELTFGWKIEGTASFRPVRVFSSPDFVWVELPKDARSPVVFAKQGDTWGIVNYNYRGHWIVVQTKANALELRAGGQTVDLYSPSAWQQHSDHVNAYGGSPNALYTGSH